MLLPVGAAVALGLGYFYYTRRKKATTKTKGGSRPGPTSTSPGLAQEVYDDLLAKGAAYDRELMRRWQKSTGKLVVDGLYGVQSAKALEADLGHGVPAPVYTPKDVQDVSPKIPPTTTLITDEDAPKTEYTLAVSLYEALLDPPPDKELVRAFQKVAGLTPDGKYGPKTRAALSAALPAPYKFEASHQRNWY